MNYYGKNYKLIPIEHWDEFDLKAVWRHRNDYDTWETLGQTQPISWNQQTTWYAAVIEDPTKQYFIMDEDRYALIRIDEIDMINRSARVGCDVFKPHRQKGYAAIAIFYGCSYCFEILNMRRLWLLVLESNVHALSVYKKAGFEEEGRMKQAIFRYGRYQDYIMMSLFAEDFWSKNDSIV